MAPELFNAATEAGKQSLKHFVTVSYAALTGRGQDGVERDTVSAFVVSIYGVTFLVTAGHAIDQIKELIDNGVPIQNIRIHDLWSSDIVKPYPALLLPFVRQHWASITAEDGTDFGLIMIPELLSVALEQNGVVPIDENHWAAVDDEPFDAYAVAGLPASARTFQRVDPERLGIKQTVYVLPCLPESDPPAVLSRGPSRFFAKIMIDPDSDAWSKIGGDIVGMSGGPVVGVRWVRGSTFQHAVVGVQSAWDKTTRVIAACRIRSFLHSVQVYLTGAAIAFRQRPPA